MQNGNNVTRAIGASRYQEARSRFSNYTIIESTNATDVTTCNYGAFNTKSGTVNPTYQAFSPKFVSPIGSHGHQGWNHEKHHHTHTIHGTTTSANKHNATVTAEKDGFGMVTFVAPPPGLEEFGPVSFIAPPPGLKECKGPVEGSQGTNNFFKKLNVKRIVQWAPPLRESSYHSELEVEVFEHSELEVEVFERPFLSFADE